MKNQDETNSDINDSQIKKLLNEIFEEIESRSIGTSHNGIDTSFYDFDAITQGLAPSYVYIIGGRPCMGKTAFTLNIAKNISQIQKLPICFFSLEMSKKMLSYRLLSMETGIESGRLKTGRLTMEEWPILGEAINFISKNDIFFVDKQSIQVSEIRDFCNKVKTKTKKNIGLIVIDNLQLMEDKGLNSNIAREDELSKILCDLKNLALSQKVPILITSQLKRELEERTNKRPILSDLRESDQIENYADLIAFIYRDEYYNPETEERGITEIIVTKQKDGPVGTVKLLFEPQYTRFRNLAI